MFTNDELAAIADFGAHALALYDVFPKVLRVNGQSIDIIAMSSRVSVVVLKARGILQDNITKEAAEKQKAEAIEKK